MKRFLLLFFLLPALALQGAIINGFITDESNGEPVPDVVILVKGTNLGAYTNNKGFFMLKGVPEGEVELVIHHMAFSQRLIRQNITDIAQEVSINLELGKNVIESEEIQIVGDEFGINTRDIKVATVHMKTNDFHQVSQIAEADVFRALQSLPGVTPISDFSSGLYVRGGSPDQNLILIDGIDVYNPTHFGGFFSIFNADAVKKVELLKGGFPARWGGRLSSVLDITNKEGNRKHMEGVMRTSMIASSATFEAPLSVFNEKGSVMGSFRRTYIDLAKKALDLNIPDYYFYDGHAKVNWDYSDKDRFSLSTYFGKDALSIDIGANLDFTWGNETISAEWSNVMSADQFATYILAWSHFGSKFDWKNEDTYFTRENNINDITFKGNISYKLHEDHMLDYGFDYKTTSIDFHNKTDMQISEDRLPYIDVSSNLLSLYVQDNWDYDALLTFQPGFRINFYRGTSEYLENNPKQDYFNVVPRFAIRYKTSVTSILYASYGVYHQYLTLVGGDESSPFDIWFPLDRSLKPGKSNHFILGFKAELPGRMAFEIEGYYKDYDNLVIARQDAEYEWHQDGTLADVLNIGDGYTKLGCDVLLRTNWQGVEGFIGYSHGITKRRFETLNRDPETMEEEFFYPKYDRTHQINLVETYNLTDHMSLMPLGADINIGFTYTYGTGQPYWVPEHIYVEEGVIKYMRSYRDRYRLKPYSRLDINLKMLWEFESWSIEPYLQIINVFDRENVWQKEYILEQELDVVTVEEHDINMFPLIPFVGFNMKF